MASILVPVLSSHIDEPSEWKITAILSTAECYNSLSHIIQYKRWKNGKREKGREDEMKKREGLETVNG